MAHGRHATRKRPSDPTYNAQWSGVSYAPHCRYLCACGQQLHHEAGSHYCPGCDDYKAKPKGCSYA